MFLTNLMPIIAVCLVWRFLLHPYGLVNQLLAPLRRRPRSTGSPATRTAMPAIVMVTVWRFAPYFMVVFLAALAAIPAEYYEAAAIDGARRAAPLPAHHAAAAGAAALLRRRRRGAAVGAASS